jgi:hypothetical protein
VCVDLPHLQTSHDCVPYLLYSAWQIPCMYCLPPQRRIAETSRTQASRQCVWYGYRLDSSAGTFRVLQPVAECMLFLSLCTTHAECDSDLLSEATLRLISGQLTPTACKVSKHMLILSLSRCCKPVLREIFHSCHAVAGSLLLPLPAPLFFTPSPAAPASPPSASPTP